MNKREAVQKMAALASAIENETNKPRADAYRAEFARIDNELKAGGDAGPETRGAGAYGGRDSKRDADFESYLRNATPSGSLLETRVNNGLTTSPNSSQTTTDDGGYTVAPAFWQNFQVALKAYGGLSQHYRQLHTSTGAPMNWPTINPTGFVGSIVGAELTQQAPVTSLAVGLGVMQAWTYTPGGPILVSVQLANDSQFPMVDYVADWCGESIGRAIAAHAATGTGSSQPLGIYTALGATSSTGTVSTTNLATFTPTGGFVTLAAGNTVSTFVGTSGTELGSNVLGPTSLLAMLASVDVAYYRNAAWYFHPTQLYNMRALVDGQKRPLLNFENGFDAERLSGPESEFDAVNAPIARLYGFDVYADASIPALIASTTGGPLFGDLSKAMVQRTVGSEGQGTSVMVLRERYADYLAVAVYAYHRCDIRSNDLRSVATVKCAAT